jgi:taurine dioxygenase
VQSEIRFSKLGDSLGVAVEGIDLRQPLIPELVDRVHQAQLEHLVVCIRGQSIDAQEFRAAMSCFGTAYQKTHRPLHADFPDIEVYSSDETKFQPDGKRLVFGAMWHTDGSYMAAPPSLTVLYGIKVPTKGGNTQFCNLYTAYEALPDATKQRIEGMKLVYNLAIKAGQDPLNPRTAEESAALAKKFPPIVHPLVRTHPETGRRALYICGERMDHIVDMDPQESKELLQQLYVHATAPKFQYSHQWLPGDIVIWDNRCLMHKANGDYAPGETRYLYRMTLEGSVPF